MKKDELIPLKRVLDKVGVSRATLWRASRSGMEGFAPPTIVRGRLYWKKMELPAIENALDDYQGRGAFDRQRQRDRRRTESRRQELLQVVAKSRRKKHRKVKGAADIVLQGDLFSDV